MSLCHYMVNIHSGAVTLMILSFCLQKNEKNYSNTVMISVLLTLSAVQMRLSEAQTGLFFSYACACAKALVVQWSVFMFSAFRWAVKTKLSYRNLT